MSNNITSSTKAITREQIGRICDKFSTALRKGGFTSEPVQRILTAKGNTLISELVAVVRDHVEMISKIFTRTVNVPPRTAKEALEALEATGRALCLNDSIVATIPDGKGGEITVTFFKIGRTCTNTEVLEEYRKRTSKPAPFVVLSKINEDDPAFADDHPNATLWDESSYATFRRWRGERRVHVNNRNYIVWNAHWWFAGVPAD